MDGLLVKLTGQNGTSFQLPSSKNETKTMLKSFMKGLFKEFTGVDMPNNATEAKAMLPKLLIGFMTDQGLQMVCDLIPECKALAGDIKAKIKEYTGITEMPTDLAELKKVAVQVVLKKGEELCGKVSVCKGLMTRMEALWMDYW